MITTQTLPYRGSKALADELNRESARHYNAVLTNHWRTFRKKSVWLSQYGAMHDESPGGVMFSKKLEASRPTTVVEQHSFGAHWQNALRLSMTRALSVFAMLLAVGAAWGTYAAYTEFGEPAVLLVGALFVAPAIAFGIGLWRNTDRVQEKLWAAEVRDGKDYDNDQVIGKPKKEPRFINVAGVPVPFDDDDDDDEVPVLLTGFNASKAVVLAFFTEASVRGLTRTSLVVKPPIMLDDTIPLNKPVWDHFTTQAEINGWITTDGPGTSYRWVAKADAVLKAIRNAK